MLKGNKIHYITAAVMVLWLYAADYGFTAAVELERYFKEDVEQ